MDRVKEHFETEACEFDQIILRLIPYYREMVEALVFALPFGEDAPIRVLDLGCGTGTVAKRVLERFPSATVTCLDFSAKMIDMAKLKLAGYSRTEYTVADFRDLSWRKSFDAAVSSLALHHLVTDEEKRDFYGRVRAGLEPGGCFYNADVVLASSPKVQDLYLQKWKEFMCRSVSEDEVKGTWMRLYREEDHPASLENHLAWLREAGFQGIDVLWKYYNFAVFGGTKL